MSTGEIDQVSQFVSDNLTKKMYLNNRRYWNENGQFLHGYHHEDVVALVKRALNTKELVSSPNSASPKLPDKLLDFMCYLVDNCEGEVVSEERLLVIGSDYIRSRQLSGG